MTPQGVDASIARSADPLNTPVPQLPLSYRAQEVIGQTLESKFYKKESQVVKPADGPIETVDPVASYGIVTSVPAAT